MNKVKIYKLIGLALILNGIVSTLQAVEGGTTAGAIMRRSSAARPSALGDAFTSMTDDITALNFNPASLASLSASHLSLQFQEGIFDDSFSQLAFGSKLTQGVLGISVGMYDAGTVKAFDGVSAPHDVNAQRDLLVNLGYGFKRNQIGWGGSVKYLSSELAETEKASAFAVDLGMNFPLSSRWRAGFAGSTYSSQLKYAREKEDLPRSVSAGLSFDAPLDLSDELRLPVLLLMDVPYSFNDEEITPSIGTEVRLGVLAVRAGWQFTRSINNFTVGTGFYVNSFSFDYSFGIVQESNLDPAHHLSLSMRFKGGDKNATLGAKDQKKPVLSRFPSKEHPLDKIVLSTEQVTD